MAVDGVVVKGAPCCVVCVRVCACLSTANFGKLVRSHAREQAAQASSRRALLSRLHVCLALYPLPCVCL